MKVKDAAKKEKMLKKIRRALVEKSKEPFPGIDYESNVFVPFTEVAEIEFAQRFTDQGGKFVFCENNRDFSENLKFLIAENKWKSIYCANLEWKEFLLKEDIVAASSIKDLPEIKVALTTCEALIARNGSVLITDKQIQSLQEIANPEVHLIIAYTHQLITETKEALKQLKMKYPEKYPSFFSFISGPSKTNSIEAVTIVGAQGPNEVYLFLLD
ncbi:MAG: LUD domain-containing protein [Bacteroidia bacterium]|nr:LUD domain-containing protein [Bacteroidia bacterium]